MKPVALPMVFAALMLAACTGSLFKTKAVPPTMYMLSASQNFPRPNTSSLVTAPELAVLKPRVRAGLDTDRIAALYPDRRVDYFADARWSGPLDEVLQELAVQEFRSNSALRNVSADASIFPSTHWLEIEVTDFQAEYSAAGGAPTVHVRLQARIGNSGDRHILARFEPDIRELATDNRMSAIVDAFSRAANKAFAEIAEGALQALGAK